MANKLPDSGPISMLDIYNVLKFKLPDRPEECDYYFETDEDFENRIDSIVKENNGDLINKSFGFGENATYILLDRYDISSTPKLLYPKSKDFRVTFSNSDINEISPILFIKCDFFTNMNSMFDSCMALTTIPEELFSYYPNITSFNYTFGNGDIGLSSIRPNIFANNILAEDFSWCFFDCTDTEIPKGLFKNNINAKNFRSTFEYCWELTTVPFDLFDNCRNITNVRRCFADCTEITSALPDVWNKDKFPNVTDGTDYAKGCTKAANWNEIPSNFGGPSTNPPVTLNENTINNTKSLVNSIIRTVNIPTSPISLNDKDFRELAGISNGQISLRDFYGKGNTEHVSEYVLLNERPYPNPWEGIPNRTASYNMQIPHKIIKGTLSVTISASKGGLSSSVKEFEAAYVDVKNIGKVETKQGTKTQNFDVSNLSGSIPVTLYCGRLYLSYGKEYSYDTSVVIKFTGEWEA